MPIHSLAELGNTLARWDIGFDGPPSVVAHASGLTEDRMAVCLLAAILRGVLDASRKTRLQEPVATAMLCNGPASRLKQAGVYSTADAMGLGEVGLLAKRGIGPDTIAALRVAFHRRGLLLPYRGIELPDR